MKSINSLIVFGFFILCQLHLAAQNSGIITGKVTDEESNPIARVSVLIKGTKTGTTTDDNGNFSIEAGMGNVLVFTSVSYETKEVKIVNTTLSIRLSLQIKPLERVLVSGNMVASKRKADVHSVTELSAKDLEEHPGFNLINILEGVVPGVTFTSIGTTLFRVGEYYESGINMRGAAKLGGLGDASSVKTYIDGIVYAGGTNYLAMINKDDIEKIEIVRGPASATLYGSGASGGVMLIQTKKGRGERTTINAATSTGFQKSEFTEKENRFQQKHNVEFYQGIKNFSYVIGGNYRTQDDYLPNGSVKVRGGYANFKYHFGKFRFNLNNNYNVNDIMNSRYPIFDTVTGAGNYFWTYKDSAYIKSPSKIQSGTVSLTINFQSTSWWTHTLVLGYNKNKFRRATDPSVFTDTVLIKYYMLYGGALGVQEWNRKDETPTISYTNQIKIGKADDLFRTDIISGLEYSNTRHDNLIYNTGIRYTASGGYTYSANRVGSTPAFHNNREFTGLYLQATQSYKEKYFIVAGMRYEKSNLSIAVVNPKIGFTTHFEYKNLTIKPRINWGRGITPPPYIITHPQPGFGGVIFIANPDIKPQEQFGYDAGIEIFEKSGKYRAEVIRYNNTVKNGFGSDVDWNLTPSPVTYFNIGKFSNRGWEFIAEFKMKNFKITGNYSIIRSVLIDSFNNRGKGDRIGGVPNLVAGASIYYSMSKLLGKSDRFSAILSITSAGKALGSDGYQSAIDFARWREGNGPNPNTKNYSIEISAITKFNLNLEYQFHPNLKFFIQALNFTNNTTPDLHKSFPLPGASWIFGLNLNFNQTTK